MTDEPQEIHNIEAEQQLLGAVLTNNSSYTAVADIVKAEHFFDPLHSRLFEAAGKRILREDIADPVTMKVEFENDPVLKQYGGPAYLVRLAGASISAFAVRDYAGIVIDAWSRRQLVGAAREAINGLHNGAETHDVRNNLESAALAVPAMASGEAFEPLSKSVVSVANTIADAYQSGVDPSMSSGFMSIDAILGGLVGGDLLTIAGNTSMGKTTVALAIMERIASSGIPGAIVSREMPTEQLASRLISRISKVPYKDMRKPSTLQENDIRGIVMAAPAVAELPLFLVPPRVKDLVGISAAIRQIRSECERRGTPLGAAMVDYMQIVQADGFSTTERVGNVARGLKDLAVLLDIPIIALAQLSRSIAAREDKRPLMSDLKDTSEIEQASDQVMFCHREEYWLEREPPKQHSSTEVWNDYDVALKASRNLVECIVAKNRHGGLGTAVLGLDPKTNHMYERFGANTNQGGMDL